MVDDLRSAFRQIRSNPGFSIAVVLTLALGVGATAAVFTLADPMLFRPLPFPDSDRLVRVRVNGPQGQPLGTMPVADYLRMHERHSGFSAVCAFNVQLAGRLEGFEGAVSVNGIPGAVAGYAFTEGCFDTFGIRPVIGRAFAPEEYPTPDQPATVAIVTDAFWRTALGGRSDVIGHTLRFAGPRPQAFVIVGVMPPEFIVPQTINPAPSLMIPSRVNPARATDARVSDVIARLASGVPVDAAAAEVQRIVQDVERDFPTLPQRRLTEVLPLQQALFGSVRNPLLLLLGATACVLLLACANLAHLFMARLHARDREFGVRVALGAGTWRVARQLMLEATLLALLGGVAAVLFARWAFALIIGLTPDFVWIYRLLPAAVDTRVMLFAAALIALAIAIYGVMPALLASRTDVRARLQPGGPTSSAVGRSDRLLVFGQAAIAVALLVTGALIVQSFVRFAYQPLGFNPYDVQQVRVELSPALLADPARTFAVHRAVYDQLRGRLSAPVTFSSGVPGLNIVNRADRADAEAKVGRLMSFPVADTFFDVFELTLTRGRLFDAREAFSDPPIVVIDERAAATLWPGEDPVGKTLVENTGRTQTSRTVIGVVREVRMELTERRPQVGGSAFTPVNPSTRNWFTYVRPTRQGPSADDIRKLAAEAVPAEFVAVTPLRLHERALGQPRFLAALLGALSLLTIALTIVGVFGVVNHNVARRTREVGIRVALGAGAANVYRLLLGRPVLAATAGAVAGLGVSWWWSRSLSALLYDVQPHDVVTYAATAAGVVLLVAAAALLPTWRASHIDPTMTLRVE